VRLTNQVEMHSKSDPVSIKIRALCPPTHPSTIIHLSSLGGLGCGLTSTYAFPTFCAGASLPARLALSASLNPTCPLLEVQGSSTASYNSYTSFSDRSSDPSSSAHNTDFVTTDKSGFSRSTRSAIDEGKMLVVTIPPCLFFPLSPRTGVICGTSLGSTRLVSRGFSFTFSLEVEVRRRVVSNISSTLSIFRS
jgi:hypothetical protein